MGDSQSRLPHPLSGALVGLSPTTGGIAGSVGASLLARFGVGFNRNVVSAAHTRCFRKIKRKPSKMQLNIANLNLPITLLSCAKVTTEYTKCSQLKTKVRRPMPDNTELTSLSWIKYERRRTLTLLASCKVNGFHSLSLLERLPLRSLLAPPTNFEQTSQMMLNLLFHVRDHF